VADFEAVFEGSIVLNSVSLPFVLPAEVAKTSLRKFLSSEGLYQETEINNGYGLKFACHRHGRVFSVTLYVKKTGFSSVVIADGVPEPIFSELQTFISSLDRPLDAYCGAAETNKTVRATKATAAKPRPETNSAVLTGLSPVRPAWSRPVRIGTDESGKGDYFGPLVTAAVFLDEELETKLIQLGARDSKVSTDAVNLVLAKMIKEFLGPERYEVVVLPPVEYNQTYNQMRNLNRVLAFSHATVIDRLMNRVDCRYAIADQFGDERYILEALRKLGRQVELFQTPRAERDTAVAAASILAREGFLLELEKEGRELGIELLKGAGGQVDRLAATILRLHGPEGLGQVAKLHFRNSFKAGLVI
jgi:ribonuclease HIII